MFLFFLVLTKKKYMLLAFKRSLIYFTNKINSAQNGNIHQIT